MFNIKNMKSHSYYKWIVLSCMVIISCNVPYRSYKSTPQPSPPNYSQKKFWASLPNKKDSADFQSKKYGIIDNQKNAKADVFFIPPTNYLKGTDWNASVHDTNLTFLTEKVYCKYLASAFNGSCKVYVPHIRGANIAAYFADKKNADQAFNLGYSDVKAAFLYYLKHYNQGRPIVIASHSQGTDYAIVLLKEFFDMESPLNKQLVEAYIIGRPIYDTTFKYLKISNYASHTGGFVVWNTVSYKTNTFYGNPVGTIIGVNPLSWKTDTVYVPKSQNKGSLQFVTDIVDDTLVDAKLAPSGFLWVHKPQDRSNDVYPGINSFYYHKEDYAFFYMNIRENVKVRIEQYLKENKKE